MFLKNHRSPLARCLSSVQFLSFVDNIYNGIYRRFTKKINNNKSRKLLKDFTLILIPSHFIYFASFSHLIAYLRPLGKTTPPDLDIFLMFTSYSNIFEKAYKILYTNFRRISEKKTLLFIDFYFSFNRKRTLIQE